MADLDDLLESYYDEIDPGKRWTILEEYLASEDNCDPAAAYRKALYEYRCIDSANPERKVDRFMLAFLDYLYLYRSSRVFPARHVKETLKTLHSLELDDRVHTDPLFAEALSLEIRNAVKRYFETCKSDNYHRKFFGVTASNADEKEKQRCFDAWRMSYGLAEHLGIEEEMALFCRAVSDEYRLSRADGLSLKEAYRSYKK